MSPVSNSPNVFPISTTPPPPPPTKTFSAWETQNTNKQVSNQTNKANLLTLKTAGQKALIAGYMRLFSLDEVLWLKSKAIKTSTTIRRLKQKNTFYSTLFLLYLLTRFLFFFSYFLQRKNEVIRKYGKRCENC